MMTPDMEKKIYASFSPSPLRVDQEQLYVDLDEVRGEEDIVNRLSRKIELSSGSPICQLLAGHKGCGKSTELIRLKNKLERDEPKFFVVFCDIYENLNPEDVDFPDILVEVVGQIETQLRERAGINLGDTLFKSIMGRMGKALSSLIEIDNFQLGPSFAKIAGAIKSSPDRRREIRQKFDDHTDTLLNAANDLIGEAYLKLQENGYSGLVVLVDNLDKMAIKPGKCGDCDTAEYLFINRAAQMMAFGCHVVYTIPLSLAYSKQVTVIANLYGDNAPLIPATKIATRPPKNEPYKAGVDKFKDIVKARLDSVEANFEDVFGGEEVLERLIALSGGQPTELMAIVRKCIVDGLLPIDDKALDRAKREGRREYARMLLESDKIIIGEIAESGDFNHTKDNDKTFRELLNNRAILQYINDDQWYAPNPVVLDLIPEEKG